MRKLLPLLAALSVSPAFAQVDITSPSGDWTATLGSVDFGVPPSGHNGQFTNLTRNGNDNLWETMFYEATSTNGNLTRRIEETYTQTMENIGANSASFRLVRDDSRLQLDVSVVMIDGEDGGALVDIQWTNIGNSEITVKPFVYADLDVDGDFNNNTGRWLMGTAGLEQTQLSTGVSRRFGESDIYTGWGIEANWPGMRGNLDQGVSALDNCCDNDVPDDYTAALSGRRLTLQPGETHEFSFRLGGVGGEDCDVCDMDCDGDVDAFDIEPFLALLFDENLPPCCGTRGSPPFTGDTDEDGDIDAFDIEPFLACLFP